MWLFQKPKIKAKSLKYFYLVHILGLFSIFTALIFTFLLFFSGGDYDNSKTVFLGLTIMSCLGALIFEILTIIMFGERLVKKGEVYDLSGGNEGPPLSFFHNTLIVPKRVAKINNKERAILFVVLLAMILLSYFAYENILELMTIVNS